ncbi:DadA Glycine D-amino acid oxidase deaminating [Pyrenophora tritici-repentis]|uniref:DadA, Glycine-D-amino acid oxidase (Deaminating) n=2 Tax=Pyrenophora tritici-repentis TaxID=45151 RepID=A0A2W1E6X2_9PLEO|nr:fructosyl-amino acid oxidase [Pyrenophora tritici-repentis Pt-1C-BFP]KAA8613419.1 Fructosyl amine:oxygen oxidoreductase [Pyrenophora tritici-repentis]EDU49276.1 fructosyl-amino acid oxidase [Pyrenophora tritici-repentis Pt-1C-BFP]KAF7445128.1 Fructosyl amine oxygen oxidoreductase [Pyrenophora tritici-repentis]KAF7565396.1 DadA, Glycine-D-amino acid oxidase (deaminating) [Pyrenophora tritici-repentis]KAI0582656.1 Fructosyl amine:oxygen oxidoreductase [Pyrenophora tritici-repentis]
MSSTSNSSLLIIGAGTWGCSIALELARRGHTSITVLDGSPFPSPISAGNDINKIAEEGNEPSASDSDEEYFWNKVTQIAMHAWKHDPLFSPLYHETGFIMAAVSDGAYARCLDYAKGEKTTPVALNTKQDFQKTMPEGVLQGELPGWRGFWKKQGAGWVFASGTLKAMHQEAVNLGVHFVTGTEGKTEEFLYTSNNTIRGAKTANGGEYTAEHIILSAGANSERLLDFKKQLRPTAWTLAHLPLSADEAARYRNLPVLYGVDRGFFIEPDVEKHEIKLCDEHPGYINPEVNDGELHSVPFSREEIPREAELRMRRLLSETMPQFAERPFSFTRICWDADTVDRMFLLDKHPEVSNLIVAVGGSGNGFMACPAIGKLVADVFEAKVDERLRKVMRWRPEIAVERDWWDAQGRYGADGKVMDFRQVEEWTTVGK